MISAIVLTKNEEKNIEDCLGSLSWCDEVIVLDDNSTDSTINIAAKKGAKVIQHKMENDFSEQRNFGLSRAKGDWVLFVDADERVTPALWYEIMQYTNNPINNFNGFYIKRLDVLWGKELTHGEISNIKLLRLAKKNSGKWKGKVHENWEIPGKTEVLKNPLLHYPHQTVAAFLKEINFYTDLRAAELFKSKVKVYWWSIIIFPVSKFVYNFVFRRGFLDGLPGLVFALMMSFHSYLVRAKLWLLWKKNK